MVVCFTSNHPLIHYYNHAYPFGYSPNRFYQKGFSDRSASYLYTRRRCGCQDYYNVWLKKYSYWAWECDSDVDVLTVNTFDAYRTGAYLDDSVMLLCLHILDMIFNFLSDFCYILHRIFVFHCLAAHACEEDCYNVYTWN